jgi:TolB protein
VVLLLVLAACERQQFSEPTFDRFGAGLATRADGEAHLVGPPGSVVFYSARGGATKIFTMDPDGSDAQQITAGAGADIWPDISPNGKYVAFVSNRSGNNEIYVLDLRDGALLNVSNNPSDDNWPRWSPDGQRIAFHSNRDANYNIFTVNADGTDLQRVTSDPVLDQFPDWSPDGKRLAFRRGTDVYVADADGIEQNVQRLTSMPSFLNQMPAWSPNGEKIAFMSTRDGYPSVFLMGADGDTPEHPAVNLTPKGATDLASAWVSRAPSWSKNGQQIYFMSMRPLTGTNVELFAMNADGTGVTRLTVSPGDDGGPRMR